MSGQMLVAQAGDGRKRHLKKADQLCHICKVFADAYSGQKLRAELSRVWASSAS